MTPAEINKKILSTANTPRPKMVQSTRSTFFKPLLMNIYGLYVFILFTVEPQETLDKGTYFPALMC